MPVPTPPSPQSTPQGRTQPAQGETQRREPVPRMPHEHDESSDSQRRGEASQPAVGQQAHDDLQKGRQDTDRGPVMDATYDKLRKSAPR